MGTVAPVLDSLVLDFISGPGNHFSSFGGQTPEVREGAESGRDERKPTQVRLAPAENRPQAAGTALKKWECL